MPTIDEQRERPTAAAVAGALMRSGLVWDNHGCMPLRPDDERFLPQLARYRAAGVNVVTLNVAWDGMPPDTALPMLSTFRRWLMARPDEYLLVEMPDDLDRARQSGRLGVLFDIEGGNALQGRLEMLARYYVLGVRWMCMTYNVRNALGGGCLDDPDLGLTAFGRAVVREMERIGMVVCCTHTGLRTALEVMDQTTRPVIFSHSNPLGVWRHRRNISDDAIRACARTGGVVGIVGDRLFLGVDQPTPDAFARHAAYVIDLVGPAHVGLGIDYVFDLQELDEVLKLNPTRFPTGDGFTGPSSCLDPESLGEVVELLLHWGYPDDAVMAFLGGNLQRVAREVWRAPSLALADRVPD